MARVCVALFVLAWLAGAGDGKRVLRARFRPGDRVSVTTIVSYDLATTSTQGQRVTTVSESVQRTERFVDTYVESPENGALAVERTYTKLFTKLRSGDQERPTVVQSPLSGKSVRIEEQGRRRLVTVQGREAVDDLLRRTAGMEIDWRDILPDDPVGPGDAWDADATALAKRLDAYLATNQRGKMRVHFESIVRHQDVDCAKLYVEWELAGMRDRNLSTRVVLAGNAYFDLVAERFVEIDLAGTQVVRGAILANDPPRIVKGEGPVAIRVTIRPAPVQAAADGE
jgi:hypothetical protein